MTCARMRWLVSSSLALLAIAPSAGSAHESRPAYLEITESEPGRYEMLWKVPRRGDLVLPLSIAMPEPCVDVAPPSDYVLRGAAVRRRWIRCADDGLGGSAGLGGKRISIEGLSETLTDVLVRIETRGGKTQTLIVKPDSPSFIFAARQSHLQVAAAYSVLGVEHILSGIDHLLFVFCLLLLVEGLGPLVKTVTAFTLAHSITLGLATLGIVGVPQAPVEAVIALSILFLARELALEVTGTPSLTKRQPWIVALCFGLLHGFGFAGALSEVGLPHNAIPLALLSFNVGVEAGQVIFIAAASAGLYLLRRVEIELPSWSPTLGHYAIGTLAGFWLIARLSAF